MIRARFDRLEEIEVMKVTEKQVLYLHERGHESREAKIADWQSWHNTKEDAIIYLTDKKQREIDSCLNRIKYLKKEIDRISKMEVKHNS